MNTDLNSRLLSVLRMAVAHTDTEKADVVLAEILAENDQSLTIRAYILMGLLHHEAGSEPSEAWLNRAAKSIADRQSALDEADLGADGGFRERVGPGDSSGDQLEVRLQLARAWSRTEHESNARDTYSSLLKALQPYQYGNAFERHIAAIGEYRLADLRVKEAPLEAYQRWRQVVEMRDEEVSPYAALRMALQFGSRELINQRVEWLFHYAMRTTDPRLYAEAALGLARYLREQQEFDESRRYLEEVIDVDGCPELSRQAGEELAKMDDYERTAKGSKALRRQRQMQATARRGVELSRASARRVIIVGAGRGGRFLLDSLDPGRYSVCGIVDDYADELPGHPEQPILGPIDELQSLIRDLEPDEILLAIPSLPGERRRDVALACRRSDTPLLSLPGVHELGVGWTRKRSSRSWMNQLRPLRVAETLGKERVDLDTEATGWLQYGIALVIGAGAIGSELCRRLADADVGRLIVVDKRESALKKVETELRDIREFWALDVRLGDAREPGFLAGVFEDCSPYIVFNATGDSSALAFEERRLATDPRGWRTLFNNEVGVAWEAARAAGELGVPRVIHVSTRRAGIEGDPLGEMKRLCEEIFFSQASRYPETVHAVVRTGALLDSRNGPFATMEKKIRAGSVVAIPASNAVTTFLPIARWAELALHAGRLADGGELFEPEGGVPFTPEQVAREAIELAGLYPGDVVIDAVESEHWDESCSQVGGGFKGDPELGMRVLERGDADERLLEQAIERCAKVFDRKIAAGSGNAAALVSSTLHRLSIAEVS